MPLFTQLLSVKSMMRNFPANGTAGLARASESTVSRVPSPPANIIASVFMVKSLIVTVIVRGFKLLDMVTHIGNIINSGVDSMPSAIV